MQKKDNFFTDNLDLQFHFDKKVEWDLLYDLSIQEDRDSLGVSNSTEYHKCFRDLFEQLHAT